MAEITDASAILHKIIDGVDQIDKSIEEINTNMQHQLSTNKDVQGNIDLLRSGSEDIKLSTGEQKIAVYEITQSMSSINDLSVHYASGAEEIAKSSKLVADMAAAVKYSVDFFKV